MRRARLLLADDHRLVVEAFTKLLEAKYDLVGTAEDGRALIDQARRLRPDVVLVDISMPVMNGVDATREIRKALPDCKVIFVTMHDEPALVSSAFRAGGSGYVLKRSAGSELITAIREVLRGQSYITPLVTRDTLMALMRPARRANGAPEGCLTPRQREVLQLVAEGQSSKEIADMLGVSVKTVEFHRYRVMQNLDLHSTAELTRYAIQQGLVRL